MTASSAETPSVRLHRPLPMPGEPPHPHYVVLGMGTPSVNDSVVEIDWDPPEHVLNSMGFVHGGYVAMALDHAAGMAARVGLNRHGGDMVVVTSTLNIQYFRPVLPGHHLVIGQCVRAGRTVVASDAEVRDSQGRLCNRGQGTFSPRSVRPDG